MFANVGGMMDETEFVARYGAWGLIAGASEGLGEAFADALARRGLNVILIARRAEALQATAERIRRTHRVEVSTVAMDLASPDLGERVLEAVGEREVGLLVYNAAFSRIGGFFEQSLSDQLRTIDVNCRGPVVLAHLLGARMRARKRGGIILMGSMTGLQGSPRLASYAASKAFLRVLGESLWGELREHGVDAMTCVAGATRTPGFESSGADAKGVVMEPRAVVEEALAGLGKHPSRISGWANRGANWVMSKLPRKHQVAIMAHALRSGVGSREDVR